MKYLLLFLVSFNINATYVDDVKARLSVIGVVFKDHNSAYGLRALMEKCNYKRSNSILFLNDLYLQENEDKLICLESKAGEVNAEAEEEVKITNRHKTLRTQLNSYDCSTLNGYIRLICRKNKRSGQ